MTSDEARGRVLDYAYGEMSPEEVARFEAVLAGDEALRADVEAVRAVREAASGLAAVPLPVDVRARLLREAERYARRRAGTVPVLWSFLERFLLSPAFAGALVVVVAVGVGVHLLLEVGTEDRLSRIERAERAAVSESEPAEAPAVLAGERDRAGGVPPVGGAETDARKEERRGRFAAKPTARGDQDEAKATPAAPAGSARERARKKATEKVAIQPPPAPARTPADRRVQATPTDVMARAPAGLSAEVPATAAGRRPSAVRLGGGGTTRRPAARPEAAGAAPPAEEAEGGVAQPAVAEDREQALGKAQADLARARLLKAEGSLDAALTAYRKALGSDTLTGADLCDALAEAAEVALALGRPDAARAFIERLKALPGGPARAAPLERRLNPTDSE